MNESEWAELQGLWKSLPQQAEPVVTELARLRRWRKWRVVAGASEALIAVGGLIVGITLIGAGEPFLTAAGVATCVFVVAVCALSLSVWLTPQPRLDDAVEHAVATARPHAHVGVRHAAALVWAFLASMAFAAVMALARGLLSETAALAGYVAIGGMQLALAVSLALAFRYYQTRSAALARLDAIAAELER
jgi:hypothetical protein